MWGAFVYTFRMHEVLYRKYRPQQFKDVVGQESVVNVLEGAIKAGHIAHAYLFSGGRGTGKTSVARIFARAIGTSEKDLYEMDAASNRGIDDIRELREGVHTLPFDSRYKVYVIDECHMLTKDAWNALLKTLEEPPAHALFILATTELEKVPETIVSRCQTFRFSKPLPATLRVTIANVAKAEGYVLDPSAAALIALAAEGSFRDAFGMLEKVIAASADKKLTAHEVERAVGAPPLSLVRTFMQALAANNLSETLEVLYDAERRGADASFFLSLILARMRILLLLRHAPTLAKSFAEDVDKEELAELVALAEKKASGISPNLLLALLEAEMRIAYASVPFLPIELALLKIHT